MFKRVKQYFQYRSKGTVLFYLFGISGSGYYLNIYLHNRKYEHPIIEESLRLLQQNQNVIELAGKIRKWLTQTFIGYPLNLNISRGSKASQNNEYCQFTFRVRGPKGNAYVELEGSAKTQKGVSEAHLESDYYIPSKRLESQVVNQQDNVEWLSKEKIKEDELFWKIEHLDAEIGVHGDYRVDVIGSRKLQGQLKKVGVRETLYDIKSEMDTRKGIQPKTPEEIEQFRKQREQEMYRKIGSIRAAMVGTMMILGMLTFNYIKRNKRQSVLNSQIHQEALQIIRSNAFMKKTFGTHIVFNQQLRGGRIGNVAQFETDIIGKLIGVAKVKGQLNKKSNEWVIDEIAVIIKDKSGKEVEEHKIY